MLSPGLLIEGFEKWATASFEKKLRSTYEPQIQQAVAAMLRKFLVEQRDAAFNQWPIGPLIDVTPGAPIEPPQMSSVLFTRPYQQGAPPFWQPSLDVPRRIPVATQKYTPPPVYEQVVHKLDPEVQAYFRSTYDTQGPRASRSEVLARLASLTASSKFHRIFGASQMTLDFSELINEPKVIVINASRRYLGSMKELYGRFFLSQIKRAGEARPSGSIPCFVYIDECDEFVANDQYAADIVFKLRRKRMAVILGNQATSQILNETARRAFLSTAIKLVNVSESDSAKELAEAMNLKTEGGRVITDQFMGRPAFDFAYYIRGITKEPIPFRFQPGILEAEPTMTEEEFAEIYNEIRGRYYEQVPRLRAEPPQPTTSVVGSPAEPETQDLHEATKSSTPRRPSEPSEHISVAGEPQTSSGTEGATDWN